MVSSSLHVKRSQIQSQVYREFKQLVPQLLSQHAVLNVQLGLTTNQPSQDWVQST